MRLFSSVSPFENFLRLFLHTLRYQQKLRLLVLIRDDFRKTFKEANPDSKDVKRVAKEGGEKWKSLTDEEKKPYLDRVAKLKAQYEFCH